MRFGVSTTAFRGREVSEMISRAKSGQFTLEFSSGLPYQREMHDLYLKADCERLLHNYFPAPEVPFVLNLGSVNQEILDKSLAHCIQGLTLASLSGGDFFSVHAGFCLDPDPEALGKTFKLTQQHPREMHWKSFIASAKTLTNEAKRVGVKILFENNVLSPGNYSAGLSAGASSPVLCADPDELSQLMQELEEMRAYAGLLIDTGHLKVSAKTLKFDLNSSLDLIKPSIAAFHHSDNNGVEDSNKPLDEGYWFLPYMRRFSEAYHILEVHDQSLEEIARQRRLLEGSASETHLTNSHVESDVTVY